ncbi:MAG: T9SS type A sorting domain-containing protein, partial [bacterium]|nr:T9SS type A sorting domain-containing protein [Candidatus Kapabacteria bacterium]
QAPLQVATVAMGDGSTQPNWTNLTDSVPSTTSGGRSIIARAASGKLGAAWFKYAADSTDDTFGVYYSESADNGTSWSDATMILVGERPLDGLNINGDADTISAGANLDLAFRGEEPHVTFTGNINNRLQFANVMHWTPTTGAQIIVLSHQEPGLGAYSIPLEKRQQNMGSIAYPTLSIGDDNRHVVVAFSAVAQTIDEEGNFTDDVVSEEGFQYYRVWGVGSSDGGRNWGKPFIIQNYFEKGTDSASIEYPAASETGHVTSGSFELPLVFQARRVPGMYTFNGTGESVTDVGPITECSQHFQRFVVTPSMFRSTAAAPNDESSAMRVELFPNTTSSMSAIELELQKATSIDVTIIDALGRERAHPVSTVRYDAGIHSIRIDAASLAPGSYHCIVRHDAGVVARRLEVIR